ncbi:MAG: glycosyltransferase family 4 protein [Candidatus Binatia bacterium]
MRILVAHNFYQQPGGEDRIFASEADLLEARGHQVVRYSVHNNAISSMSRLAVARATLWNGEAMRELAALFERERPDVAHFHNTFPLISPAAYYAARAANVPVVQSLHNYRLLCANAIFYRAERVCEDCQGRLGLWAGVAHGCYRDSRAASGVVAAMLALHRARGAWSDLVDVYVVAVGEGAREKFVRGGLPAERLVVRNNGLYPDPGIGHGQGGYALYAGRLVPEKGLAVLLAAWKSLVDPPPLKIVGDGPMAGAVADAAARCAAIERLGGQSGDRVVQLMKDAHILVVPSVWYEGVPRVIVEAYAVGLPVIASDIGALSSMVTHGRTGLHFRPGDAGDLATQVAWATQHPVQLLAMRRAARAEFDARYSAERSYDALMAIYERAIEHARARARSSEPAHAPR